MSDLYEMILVSFVIRSGCMAAGNHLNSSTIDTMRLIDEYVGDCNYYYYCRARWVEDGILHRQLDKLMAARSSVRTESKV